MYPNQIKAGMEKRFVDANGAETLYDKRLKILIKSATKEESAKLTVSAEWQSTFGPTCRKDFVIRITNEADPLCLYQLRLNDEDYQSLRKQQGLLVDFSTFPQMLIDRLELCRSEESRNSPEFVLHFTITDSNGFAQLTIVKTDPFKHLVHLDLKFAPGTDSELKHYLVQCLQASKLRESDLSFELSKYKEICAKESTEKERLREERTSLQEQHESRFLIERDKFNCAYSEIQSNHDRIVSRLESSLRDRETRETELSEKLARSEATVSCLRNRLHGSENDLDLAKEKLEELRVENTRLTAANGELEKSNSALSAKVTSSEQQLRTLEATRIQNEMLMENMQGDKTRLTEECGLLQERLNRREAKLEELSYDITKANQIIRKLLWDGKLKQEEVDERAKVISEHESQMEILKRENVSLEQKMHEQEDELRKLQVKLTSVQTHLEEKQKAFETRENMIVFLNKRLDEYEREIRNQKIATTAPLVSQDIHGQFISTFTPANLQHPSRPSVRYDSNQADLQAPPVKSSSIGSIHEVPTATASATNNTNNTSPLSRTDSARNTVSGNLGTSRPKGQSTVRLPKTNFGPSVTKGLQSRTPSAYFPIQ